jgi:spermidine/putrescine transport system substrate-binding protein
MKIKTHLLTTAAALAAGTLFLAGCGKPADAPTTTEAPAEAASTPTETAPAETAPATPTPDASPSAAGAVNDEPKQLNLFCWSEYVPQTVIDAFTERTGIKVNVQNYASNEEMLQKLLSGGGQYDLLQPSEYIVEAMIKEDMLRPLDLSLIPNIKNLAPDFRALDFDPGNKFSVPWMAGTVGIVVNVEQVSDPITGFADVFQEKYKGQIVVLDDAREIVSWAMAANGLPMNDITDENIEKIRPTLQSWLPLVKVYDSDSPKTAMINGDVSLGVVWSGEGALLLDQAPEKFKWVLPSEGTHLFVDSLVIPKTAAHPKNAQMFINFILEPEISAMISEDFPYLNPNAAARALLTPEQLANVASFPPDEVIAELQTFKDIGEQSSVVDDMITTIKIE